jgi:hypothetical protein
VLIDIVCACTSVALPGPVEEAYVEADEVIEPKLIEFAEILKVRVWGGATSVAVPHIFVV